MNSRVTPRYLAYAVIGAFIISTSSTVAVSRDVKRISANGTEFAYVELGQGAPIVFVHGGLQDYRMWDEHLPKFAERFRAIAYSRRNHAPNEVNSDGMPDGAADAHGEDLAAFVRALGLSKARVVAHSSGAHAALFFAARNPDMIVSIALNEPPATGLVAGNPTDADMLKQWANGQAPAREAIKTGKVKEAIPLFVDAVGGPGAFDRRTDSAKAMNFDNIASFEADVTTKRARPVFTCDMAKAINAPALLSNGDKSPKFFHRIIDQLEMCLPTRERIVISSSSHTVPSENPDAYNQAVLTFFEKH